MARLSKIKIMGVLNVTPDSFYDGGRYLSREKAVEQVATMLEEGVDIIDVGGESSRPGAESVSLEEEKKRVLPVVETIAREFGKLTISVDTSKPEMARAALDAGANLINDITGLASPEMIDVIKEYDCEAVMMHMQGTPRTMQESPNYVDVVKEVGEFFATRLNELKEAGIDTAKIILDPGIGFGKTLYHNLKLINCLEHFRSFGRRLLVGASRKSFIGKLLDLPVEARLEGSLAASLIAILHGAEIIRVHDVKETRRAIQVATAIMDVK